MNLQILKIKGREYGNYSYGKYPPPDSELTISGKAADAKVAGDKIAELQSDLGMKIFSTELPQSITLSQAFDKVRYGHGQCGSVYLAESNGLPNSWYWYIYIPHRSGGNNGDNPLYGVLILIPFWDTSFYITKYTSGTINVRKI